MRKSPYKGYSPYSYEDEEILGGRHTEIQDLVNRAESSVYTICYGKTGIGKTSLLRAGLSHQLEVNGHWFIHQRLAFDLDKSLFQQFIDPISKRVDISVVPFETQNYEPNSLWKLLVSKVAKNIDQKLIIVLDQFEELFFHGHKKEETSQFIYELSCLAEGRIPNGMDRQEYTAIAKASNKFHFIFSLREDYLPAFQNLGYLLPAFNTRLYRISGLKGTNALEAIHVPAASVRVHIEKEVALLILKKCVNDDDEFEPFRNLSDPEWKPTYPLLLSFYCNELFLELPPGSETLTAEFVRARPLKQYLRNHLKKALKSIPDGLKMELENLVSSNGKHRIKLDLGEFEPKLNSTHLTALKELKIITIDKPSKTAQVELVHDRLVALMFRRREIRNRWIERAAENARIKEQEKKNLERIKHEQKIIKRERKKIIRIRRVLAVVSIVLIIVMSIAVSSTIKRKEFEKQAKQKERQSGYSYLYSQAPNFLPSNPNKALSLATFVASRNSANSSFQELIESIYSASHFSKTLIPYFGAFYSIQSNQDQIWSASYKSDSTSYLVHSDINGNSLGTAIPIGKKTTAMSMAISRDNQWAAIGTDKGKVEVVNLKNGTKSMPFEHPDGKGWFFDVEFSNDVDQRYVACSTVDRADAYIFDRTDPSQYVKLQSNDNHSKTIYALKFSKVDSHLYTTAGDGKIKEWRFDGSYVRDVYHEKEFYFYDLDISRDGQHLLVASTNGNAYETDLNGEVTHVYESGIFKTLFSATYSPDGQYVVAGCLSGDAWLWHRSNDRLQRYSVAPGKRIWETEITEDNKHVLTGGDDFRLKKWSTSGLMTHRIDGVDSVYNSIFSEDGKELQEVKVLGNTGKKNEVVITTKGEREWILAGSHLENAQVHHGPSENVVIISASGSRRDSLIVLKDTQIIAQHSVSANGLITVHPKEPCVVYLSGASLWKWNWQTQKNAEVASIPSEYNAVKAVEFSKNGQFLACGTSRGSILVFEKKEDSFQLKWRQKQHHSNVHWMSAFAFSEDNTLMATASLDGSISIWDLPSGKLRKKVATDYRGSVYGLEYSEQHGLLVRHAEGSVVLYNMESGLAKQTFEVLNLPFAKPVNAEFLGDNSVVIQYKNGVTRVWEIRETLESFIESGEFDRLSDDEIDKFLEELDG